MKTRVVDPCLLSSEERFVMLELMKRHFDGISPEIFYADLDEKNGAVLIEGSMGELVGFSTFIYYEHVFDGEAVSVIYSGDTIVDPSAWNSTAMMRSVMAAYFDCHRDNGGQPLYWFLITSGFRTYRFLPVVFQKYYPHHEAPTPPDMKRLLDDLAFSKFGCDYDSSSGIVRLKQAQTLKPHLASVPETRLDNPDVGFFLQSNPGYVLGDELASITELSRENLTRAGLRLLGHALPIKAAG